MNVGALLVDYGNIVITKGVTEMTGKSIRLYRGELDKREDVIKEQEKLGYRLVNIEESRPWKKNGVAYLGYYDVLYFMKDDIQRENMRNLHMDNTR